MHMTKVSTLLTAWLNKQPGLRHRQLFNLIVKQDQALAANSVKLHELELAICDLEQALNGIDAKALPNQTVAEAASRIRDLRGLAAPNNVPAAVDTWLKSRGIAQESGHVTISVEDLELMLSVNLLAASIEGKP